MSKIKSFVRRNGRLSTVSKSYLSQREHYLCDKLPPLDEPFIGLEIGFGGGESLLDVASNNPEQLWIGVEVYEKGVASVIRQALEMELENILLRIGDVCEVMEEIPKASLDHIRIFFPDPWHKKRHHKRRLVNKVFLDQLAELLKPDGMIHFATDNQHYAESCIELVKEHAKFELSDKVLKRPMTKFAKKASEKGIKAYDIVIIRKLP